MSNALWNETFGEVGATMKILADLGLTPAEFSLRIRRDPEAAKRLVLYCKAGMPPLTERGEVMEAGSVVNNVSTCIHDARAVNDLFSLGYTEEQFTAFGPPPDSLPGFLTFFDPGWEILRLRKHCKDKGRIFYGQDWYDGEAFVKMKEKPRYRQIRMEAVEDSFNKVFDTQQGLLPDTEEVPLARQVTMGMVVHFLRTGHRLFPSCYVRCLDKPSDGLRVNVGNFNDDGLNLYYYWDDNRYDNLGMASARKF